MPKKTLRTLRKLNVTRWGLFTFFLIIIVSAPMGCTPRLPSNTNSLSSTSTADTSFAVSPTPTSAPSATPTPTQTITTTTFTFVTSADVTVKQSDPSQNYGNDTTLRVDGGQNLDESFLNFTVTGILGTIQSAQLRLYATENGSNDGPAVHATEATWAETETTWNHRPARTSDAIDNKVKISAQSWVEYNVTSAVTGDGTFSFVLAADSGDAVTFSSQEGDQPPQLVITFINDATVTLSPSLTQIPTLTVSTDNAIFVGAGDIASCENDNDELTADLLDNIPGTVFTVGDNAYPNGTAAQFANCYDPTWGRHKDRTKPVLGNHDYRTSGAAAYFQYFNNIPSYYAYDLGSWRIYALNSEIDVSAGSPEVVWLQADLATHPRQCVLAYWHEPRWSSGSTHGNSLEKQTLWRILYEAGAELVINGHEHNYERFAPMNAEGQPDLMGLREIVVGTGGGAKLYPFGTPLPTSQVRNNSTYGVLKLTLHPSRYDWQFIPVVGSIFTDSGSDNCH